MQPPFRQSSHSPASVNDFEFGWSDFDTVSLQSEQAFPRRQGTTQRLIAEVRFRKISVYEH